MDRKQLLTTEFCFFTHDQKSFGPAQIFLDLKQDEGINFFFLGYAFITMDDERDAKAAIDELNGTTIDGQEVKVELSKPRSGGKIRFS